MKILLVFPAIEHGMTTVEDKHSWRRIIAGYPIITLPHLAAITPREHEVKIVNENYEDINFDEDVDVVGITCYTMTAPRVYEIADEFRKRGKKVILGGYHPTAMSEEALQHADSVIKGMAEKTWPRALKDLEKGKLKPVYERDHDFDISKVPPLRRDLIKQNPFLGAIQTTRGCTNKCEFCAITSFCGNVVKQRPVEDVVEEIRNMPNKMFIFHDPHLTLHRKYATKLFKEMIRQKINKTWVANGTSNILAKVDKEWLDLAYKAGCVEWFVGFESVSQDALNNIKKTHNRVEDFKNMIKRVHKHGMTIQGGIIFGFDEDTPDIFETTIETINDWDLDVLEVNILTPYPGTPLFDRLDKAGRILTRDWSRYNQVDVVFQPKNMTPEELLEGARMVAKEFYSPANVLKKIAYIFMVTKRFSGIVPAATAISFRRYYKRDFGF
ncbi:MAG TPA: B12-binding domain-containing radical SAM protein [Thermoplasmatales archaeon]|nr:B12-binding domain-containing radical SAM protein [Thermoplasmatales archaeon]